jgi:hypothetical protein
MVALRGVEIVDVSHQLVDPSQTSPDLLQWRYAQPRDVAGLRFEDPDYPDHYAVPSPERRVSRAVLHELAACLTP